MKATQELEAIMKRRRKMNQTPEKSDRKKASSTNNNKSAPPNDTFVRKSDLYHHQDSNYQSHHNQHRHHRGNNNIDNNMIDGDKRDVNARNKSMPVSSKTSARSTKQLWSVGQPPPPPPPGPPPLTNNNLNHLQHNSNSISGNSRRVNGQYNQQISAVMSSPGKNRSSFGSINTNFAVTSNHDVSESTTPSVPRSINFSNDIPPSISIDISTSESFGNNSSKNNTSIPAWFGKTAPPPPPPPGRPPPKKRLQQRSTSTGSATHVANGTTTTTSANTSSNRNLLFLQSLRQNSSLMKSQDASEINYDESDRFCYTTVDNKARSRSSSCSSDERETEDNNDSFSSSVSESSSDYTASSSDTSVSEQSPSISIPSSSLLPHFSDNINNNSGSFSPDTRPPSRSKTHEDYEEKKSPTSVRTDDDDSENITIQNNIVNNSGDYDDSFSAQSIGLNTLDTDFGDLGLSPENSSIDNNNKKNKNNSTDLNSSSLATLDESSIEENLSSSLYQIKNKQLDNSATSLDTSGAAIPKNFLSVSSTSSSSDEEDSRSITETNDVDNDEGDTTTHGFDDGCVSTVPQPSLLPKISIHTHKLPSISSSLSPPPVVNPLTGNLISCCNNQNGIFLHEIEPFSSNNASSTLPIVKASTQILSHELITKLKSSSSGGSSSSSGSNKVKTHSYQISHISKITAGVHTHNGKCRVRVAVIMGIVIDHHSSSAGNNTTDTTAAVPTRKVKNVIAVWHWGYAVGRPISLQSVFSPPTTTAQTHLFQRINEDDANKSTSNSSKNYTSYCDPDTLCIADGLLFIGGSSTIRGSSSTNNKNVNSRNQEKKRVPCVWFGKIYPREKWSCIPIIFSNNHGMRNNDKFFNTVTALSVTTYTSRKLKYLAVATKDGSVSVWTYDLAVSTNRLNKDSIDYTYYVDFQKAREELIQPFCKLEGSSSFHNVTESIFRSSSHLKNNQSDDDSDDASKVVADESLKNMIDNNRYCSDLEWISPGSSVSLSLLAAAFVDGVAVYHVSLPIISNFVSTSSDIVRNVEENGGFITKHQNSVPLLSPIAIVKADVSSLTNNNDLTGSSTVASNYLPKNSVLTWLDLGPTHPPCIAVLFRSALISEDTILPEISVSSYSRRKKNPPILSRLFVGYMKFPVSTEEKDGVPVMLGNSSNLSILPLYEDVGSRRDLFHIVTFSATSMIGCYSRQDKIESISLCLKNQQQNKMIPFPSFSEKHGIGSNALGVDGKGFILSQQEGSFFHIFTQTYTTRNNPSDEAEHKGRIDWSMPIQKHYLLRTYVGDDKKHSYSENTDGEEVTGGGFSEVICEISCARDAGPPHRIVNFGNIVCVFFSPVVSQDLSYSSHATKFTVLKADHEKEKNGIQYLYDGRDVAFLSTNKIVVLSQDGYYIEIMSFNGTKWEVLGTVAIYNISGHTFECQRIFTLFTTSQKQLLLVGKHESLDQTVLMTIDYTILDRKQQLFLSEDEEPINVICIQGKLTLESEEVFNVICLPEEPFTQQKCFAIATERRVAIVCRSSMKIISFTKSSQYHPSLVPIGSHCVAYFSGNKLRYLCCLPKYFEGILATLPDSTVLIVGVRPDRFMYLSSHTNSRLVEKKDELNQVKIEIPITKPLFLLEPLICNALSQYKDDWSGINSNSKFQNLLREIMDRFGRKSSAFPYRDGEGIGLQGVGITSRTFEVLNHYGCKEASTFLLTCGGKILPMWIPIQKKLESASSGKDALQVLVSGENQHLMDYVLNPQNSMSASLPRPCEGVASHRLGIQSLRKGQIDDAIKFLDLVGSEKSERVLLDIVMSSQLKKSNDIEGILQDLTDSSSQEQSNKLSQVVAHLALHMRKNRKDEQNNNFMNSTLLSHLAPSMRRGRNSLRSRSQLIRKNPPTPSGPMNSVWKGESNNNSHVWQVGPFHDKEELLLLEKIDEWIGRRQPTIVGKEGVAMAAETGEKYLADILRAADEDENSQSVDGKENNKWVPGIGEGREDEENLSAYFRFSEGDSDTEGHWATEGIQDLTKHEHKAIIYGQDFISLEPTTSSVDEGEAGKVRALYDVVFNEACNQNRIAGMAIDVRRGSSLDVGILHTHQTNRQRCSIEVWFHLPQKRDFEELVLMRRSFSSDRSDLSKLCHASNPEKIWELVVLPQTGQLQFRTNTGSVITTGENSEEKEDNPVNDFYTDDESTKTTNCGLVSWQKENGYEGWNHVCLVFSPCSSSISEFNINIMLKGISAASDKASVKVPGSDVNIAMDRTVLLFGLGPMAGLRLTEIRVWSCERNEDDVKMMMHEYLTPAEMKRKIKVKIRSNHNKLTSPRSGSSTLRLTKPPESKSRGILPPPKRGGLSTINKKSDTMKTKKDDVLSGNKDITFFASFEDFNAQETLTNAKSTFDENTDNKQAHTENSLVTFGHDFFASSSVEKPNNNNNIDLSFETSFGTGDAIVPSLQEKTINNDHDVESDKDLGSEKESEDVVEVDQEKEDDSSSTIDASSDMSSLNSLMFEASSSLLSEEVRTSAAAAIIRGPPATRHFGGNRGGLISGMRKWKKKNTQRKKVGSIAICGTEKTVIYTFGEDPPGKTYLVGASGAIISDIIGPNKDEYLCCYMAKEKRLAVFELRKKAIVVSSMNICFWLWYI